MEAGTKIFVDSNVFISFANEADSEHKRAALLLHKLEDQDAILLINNLVFGEIVTIISMRIGKVEAIKWGEIILANPKVKIINIDETLHDTAWAVFKKISKKNISFIDCSILASMEMENIKTLATFDTTDFKPLQKSYRFTIQQS